MLACDQLILIKVYTLALLMATTVPTQGSASLPPWPASRHTAVLRETFAAQLTPGACPGALTGRVGLQLSGQAQ